MGYDGADDYVDVAAREREFFADHPHGSLRAANPSQPFEIVYLDDERATQFAVAYDRAKWFKGYQPTAFVVYTAAAYRTPDDPAPGIGVAWEPFPGMTPYTHNSEVMNAETSARGRALEAIGYGSKASAQELTPRRAEQEDDDRHGQAAQYAELKDGAQTKADQLDEVHTVLWGKWKQQHPGWHQSVSGMVNATAYLNELLADQGVDPFLDAADASPTPGASAAEGSAPSTPPLDGADPHPEQEALV